MIEGDKLTIDRETLIDIAVAIGIFTCLILLVVAYEQTLAAFARFIRQQEGEIVFLCAELENSRRTAADVAGHETGDGAAGAARDFGPAPDC